MTFQTRHDVVVVGAGPAGSIAARDLAKRGHDVLLLDRREFPRDKSCGDALIPDALALLRRVGLFEEVRARGFACSSVDVWSPRRIRYAVATEAITIRRAVLDDLLRRAAITAGAAFVRGRATGLDASPREVRVELADGSRISARAVVVATGSDVSLVRAAGAAPPSAVAVRCYVRADTDSDALIASFDRSVLPGYGWIFPLGDGWYNIGCGIFGAGRNPKVDIRGVFERFVAAFPPAMRWRGDVGRAGFSGALLRCALSGGSPVPMHRVVAIGETIGTTFPLTGEGIGKAMESALLAADAVSGLLVSDDPAALDEYAHAVESRLRPRYNGYLYADRWLRRPLIHDLVAWKAKRSPAVREALSRALAERVDPVKAFSLRGLGRVVLG